MQTVWFPVPVAALFRRIVNVVSTLSISHHYLHQPSADADSPRTHAFQALRWPAWLRASQTPWNLTLADGSGADINPQGDDLQEPTRRTISPSRPRRNDQIHQLISHPALYDPVRKPRYPIVLCHGLYGFDVRGPSSFPILQQHYWSNVLNVLRGKVGAEVLVTGVPSTGSISSRAENLDRFLRDKAPGRGINFLAHSMGGLDCRHLISHIKPTDYTPLSLTTIATPHRGSPFMDWCRQYIGLGRYKTEYHEQRNFKDGTDRPSSASQESVSSGSKQVAGVKSLLSLASLPSSFTTLLLSLLDSPAYANLTSTYLNTIFNPATPNDPSVKYFSVAGRISSMSIWHPLWLPKMVLDGFEEKERARMRESGHPIADMDSEWGNDGLVTVQSARWGEYLGVLEGCDHWDLRGARGFDVDLPSIPGPDGWNFADWGKFVRAWKREEKEAARSAGAKLSEQKHEESLASASATQADRSDGRRDTRTSRERERDSANADEVVKSSTDKLSAVFDWIVEQVPAPRSLAPLSAIAGGSGPRVSQSGEDLTKERVRERDRRTKQAERSDLETKGDLERFYVALCKKLYDEGL
ncbi:Alpha/Beta hydrolase protein [Cubamyces lactineus]|nr:Alpha/Beta hydrolase protein [Cubamyces lactineus]